MRSRDLQRDELLNTLPSQPSLRSDQTRDRRPRQILLGEPTGRRRDDAAGAEDDLRRTTSVRGKPVEAREQSRHLLRSGRLRIPSAPPIRETRHPELCGAPPGLDERGKGVKNDRLDAAALCQRLDRYERGNHKAFSVVVFRRWTKRGNVPSLGRGSNWCENANDWRRWAGVSLRRTISMSQGLSAPRDDTARELRKRGQKQTPINKLCYVVRNCGIAGLDKLNFNRDLIGCNE